MSGSYRMSYGIIQGLTDEAVMDNYGRKIPDPVREQIRFEAIENWLAGMTPTRLASTEPQESLSMDYRYKTRPENTYRKNGTQTKAIS